MLRLANEESPEVECTTHGRERVTVYWSTVWNAWRAMCYDCKEDSVALHELEPKTDDAGIEARTP